MNLLNLGKRREHEKGVELPGMVAMYLVRMPDGSYYVGEYDTVPQTTDDWSGGRAYFGLDGLLQARRVAQRYNGKIYIVNCTPAQEYKDH